MVFYFVKGYAFDQRNQTGMYYISNVLTELIAFKSPGIIVKVINVIYRLTRKRNMFKGHIAIRCQLGKFIDYKLRDETACRPFPKRIS